MKRRRSVDQQWTSRTLNVSDSLPLQPDVAPGASPWIPVGGEQLCGEEDVGGNQPPGTWLTCGQVNGWLPSQWACAHESETVDLCEFTLSFGGLNSLVVHAALRNHSKMPRHEKYFPGAAAHYRKHQFTSVVVIYLTHKKLLEVYMWVYVCVTPSLSYSL